MRVSTKILLNCILILLIVSFYIAFHSNATIERLALTENRQNNAHDRNVSSLIFLNSSRYNDVQSLNSYYTIWIVFTKATINDSLSVKFRNLLNSIFTYSSGVHIHFNIITDVKSKYVAKLIFLRTLKFNILGNKSTNTTIVSFYDIKESAQKISDIINVMTPHFSSPTGSYYSDALFYLSLGLHRIAPQSQKRAIILDCDLHFKTSIKQLFEEFDKFNKNNLFGLAHELSSVYRHVLYNYRIKHNYTVFGSEPIFAKRAKSANQPNGETFITSTVEKDKMTTQGSIANSTTLNVSQKFRKGFPGFNSGVVLLHLENIRKHKLFESLLSFKHVKYLTDKYLFRGHLGDQDFYTLLGCELPNLVYLLDCGWNRQLCKWWKRYDDMAVFGNYFRCDSPIRVYHGNCNTPIPLD